MGLISLIVVLIIVGVLLYLVENFILLSPPIRTILRVVVVLALILWLLQIFVGDITIPRIR